jgi:hypothetical protein
MGFVKLLRLRGSSGRLLNCGFTTLLVKAGVQRAAWTMFHPRQEFPLRGTIALQFIRDDDPRAVLTAFEQEGWSTT